MVYVGGPKFGIKMQAADYYRCKKTAKTLEKLALNLVEFVLTKDELNECSVMGNMQHINKKALPISKAKALKGMHIVHSYS